MPAGRQVSSEVEEELRALPALAAYFIRGLAGHPGVEGHRREILDRYHDPHGTGFVPNLDHDDQDQAEDDQAQDVLAEGDLGDQGDVDELEEGLSKEAREELRELLDQLREFLRHQAKYQTRGRVTKDQGQPCKVGETASRSGCRPRNHLAGPGSGGQAHGTQGQGTQGRQGIVGTAGRAYASARAALNSAGKAAYDRLPKPAQHAVDVGMSLHHKAEGLYRDGQRLATETARLTCPQCSQAHIDRTARILAIADGVGRLVVSTAAESVAHSVGGPVAAMVAGKAAWFLPVASMAFVAGRLAVHTGRGGNPFQIIRAARQAVKAAKVKVSRTGHIKPRRVVEHSLGNLDQEAVVELLRGFQSAPDPERYMAMVVAGLDESGMDLRSAVALAELAMEDQEGKARVKGGGPLSQAVRMELEGMLTLVNQLGAG
jgi:hypothetical protein